MVSEFTSDMIKLMIFQRTVAKPMLVKVKIVMAVTGDTCQNTTATSTALLVSWCSVGSNEFESTKAKSMMTLQDHSEGYQ